MNTLNVGVATKLTAWTIPLVVLIVIPSMVDPVNYPKLLVLSIFSAATVVFAVIDYRSLNKEIYRRNRNFIYLYLGLLISMLVFGSIGTTSVVRLLFGIPGRNNGIIYYSCVILLCVTIFLTLKNSEGVKYFIKILKITGTILALYGLLQFFELDPLPWNLPFNRVIVTLGNPNFSAAAFASFSILFFHQAIKNRRTTLWNKSNYLLSLILAFLAWSTQSLQGMVIVAVGIVLILFERLQGKVSKLQFRAFITVALSLLFFATISLLGYGPLGTFLAQYTLNLRANYISIGISAMKNYPLAGVGVDSYILAFKEFRSESLIERFSIDLQADNAHSVPFQIGSGFGLLVFLVYCLIQLLILSKAIRNLSNTQRKGSATISISIMWIVLFAQSLLSIENIGLGVLNWLLGAIVLTNFEDKQEVSPKVSPKQPINKTKNSSGASVAFLPILLMFLTIPVWNLVKEDRAWKNIFALQMVNDSDTEWVRDNFKELSSVTLYEPSKVLKMLPNLSTAGMDEEIEDAIDEVFRNNPRDVLALEMKANLYRIQGKRDLETDIRYQMRELDPLNYRFELRLAEVLSNSTDAEKLDESISRILRLAPIDSEEAKRAREIRLQTER